MVLLFIERFSKFYSRLDNHHHHHHDSQHVSSSLQAFESDVSACLNQLYTPGSEILSLPWIHQCFQSLPVIHKAFAKLVVNMEYPISKWEADSVDEYLSYSLELLQFFNSISLSVSHLGQSRLFLSHALLLLENSPSSSITRLKPIQPKKYNEAFNKREAGKERRALSGKESVLRRALAIMDALGFWICGVVISGLYGDDKAYMEMRDSACDLEIYAVKRLALRISEEVFVLKDVAKVNDGIGRLTAEIEKRKNSDNAVNEMKVKLEGFEKQLEGLGKEVDGLFSEVLAGRNQILDGLRLRKH